MAVIRTGDGRTVIRGEAQAAGTAPAREEESHALPGPAPASRTARGHGRPRGGARAGAGRKNTKPGDYASQMSAEERDWIDQVMGEKPTTKKREVYKVSKAEMNRRLGRNIPAADCGTCWKKKDCPRAQEGTFCTSWASRDPAEKQRGANPADEWERGGPAPEG